MDKSDLFFRAMKAKKATPFEGGRGVALKRPIEDPITPKMAAHQREQSRPPRSGAEGYAGWSPREKFAEGGEVEEGMEAPMEGLVSDEEKFAASEILSAMQGSGPEAAERLASSLKAFFLIVDAQPHDEGGAPPMEGEGDLPFLDR